MDSGRVNRWLTLGANFAVLLGILLILIELNQNADLMRAQMIQARIDQVSSNYDGMIHSDYWAEIWAIRRKSDSDREWITSLDENQYERVRYYYFREYEDLRGQYHQYLEGYVPEQYWQTAIRSQIIRLIPLAAAFGDTWDATVQERPFPSAVIQIAKDEGLPYPDSEGVWPE